MLISVESKCVRTAGTSWKYFTGVSAASIEECRNHCKDNNKPIFGTECPKEDSFQCVCYQMDAWHGSGEYAGNEIGPSNCKGQSCGTSLTQTIIIIGLIKYPPTLLRLVWPKFTSTNTLLRPLYFDQNCTSICTSRLIKSPDFTKVRITEIEVSQRSK